MRIFKCDSTQKSYSYSIIRLIICVVIILLVIGSIGIDLINNVVWFRVLRTIILCIAILCIYISLAEIIYVRENLKVSKFDLRGKKTEPFDIDDTISLLKNNDIIEIEAIYNNNLFKFGSSSDCKQRDAKFYDKEYYINNKSFKTIDSLKKELVKYCKDKKIFILTIDGNYVHLKD
jgi:hypothetical protein